MIIDVSEISKEAYKKLVIESLPHLLKGNLEEREDQSKNIHKILSMFSGYVYEMYDNYTKLGYLMSIDYINGQQLDNYGENFAIPRISGESDQDYKIRILTTLSIRFSNSSIPSITEVVKATTGKTADTFKIVENPIEGSCASFAFTPTDFTAEELKTALEAIELVRGAGIELMIIISQALTWGDMLNNTWGHYKENNFLW